MGKFERHRYAENWDELARACKERAGWCCQYCQGRQGDRRIGAIHGNLYTIALAACHPHHDPENPDAVLLALCQACHLRLDGPQHGRTRKKRRWQAIRAAQRAAGQRELWEWVR